MLYTTLMKPGLAPPKCVAVTHADATEKYGRYLANLWVYGEGVTWINVNQWMIDNGYAVAYDGGAR